MRIIKTKNYDDMSQKASAQIMAQVNLKPNAVLGLATGSTPIGTYKCIVESFKNGFVDFSEIKTVNLDEYVGLDGNNDQSYRYFMNDNLFNHVNIDKNNTNVPNGMASDTAVEADRYEDLIEEIGGVDMQVLGMGLNGHIGFNEPTKIFDKRTREVDLAPSTIEANARFFASMDDVPKTALSMGISTIMKARKILLLVSGSAKADILYQACYGDITPDVPASILQLHPDVTVIADEDALATIAKNVK